MKGSKVHRSLLGQQVECTLKIVVPIILNMLQNLMWMFTKIEILLCYSFQTCTLIRFQIKKPLIFVQSVSHAFVSMVTICEITCSISCFPVKLNRSLFQNFMERNRKKYKQDFDAIKPELRGYKKIHERYNQKLHHQNCLFFSP